MLAVYAHGARDDLGRTLLRWLFGVAFVLNQVRENLRIRDLNAIKLHLAFNSLAQLPYTVVCPRVVYDIAWAHYPREVGNNGLAEPRHEFHGL